MPGNTVKINDCDHLEWYVGDKQMPALVTFLDSIGIHIAPKPKTTKRRNRKRKSLRSKQNITKNP